MYLGIVLTNYHNLLSTVYLKLLMRYSQMQCIGIVEGIFMPTSRRKVSWIEIEK
jgi:hypothetical protein